MECAPHLGSQRGGVGDDQHRHALVAVQLDEQLRHRLRRTRIERAGRLVGEQERGLAHDGARDRDTLLFAARKVTHLFGAAAADWKIVLIDDYQPFLLAILPPGAFIFTGLIIAAKNLVDGQIKKRQDALKEKPAKGSKRVRVTGTIS